MRERLRIKLIAVLIRYIYIRDIALVQFHQEHIRYACTNQFDRLIKLNLE